MWPLLAVAAPVVGAAGKLFEGFARSSAGRMSAEIARSNAQLLTQQADTAKDAAKLSLLEGGWKASQIGRAVRSTQASLTSYFAGNNMDPTMGTPALMQGYSAAQGATDMALAAARGDVGYADGLTKASRIYGDAADQQWRAAQQDQAASTALVSGFFGAATSLLSLGSTPWPGLSGGGAGTGGGVTIGNPWGVTG